MPPPAIHQYVTSARPAPTAAAPMRRTAASARAGRVSTVGTGGAVGIASRVVTSTSRYGAGPGRAAGVRSGAADPVAADRAVADRAVAQRAVAHGAVARRAVAVPVARQAAVRAERAAVVAVLARRPRETGGACRVAPGRGVSDRVAPGPAHREQPCRRSGEQPGAAEVAAARRGRSRAAQGNRRQYDRPGPGRVVRGRLGHAVGDGLAGRGEGRRGGGGRVGQGRVGRGRGGDALGAGLSYGEVGRGGAVRSRCGRTVVRGLCTRRVVSQAVDGRLARRRDVPRRDVLLRHGRGGRLPAGSAVSRVVVAHCSPSVSRYRVGAPAGWSR